LLFFNILIIIVCTYKLLDMQHLETPTIRVELFNISLSDISSCLDC